MRSEKEIIELILSIAKSNEAIKIVGISGSRTNPQVIKDDFQDYDIVYFVNNIKDFIENKTWINVFGKRLFLQTPEAMDLFSPELDNCFSYLMLFEDFVRIDLILVPMEEAKQYIKKDKLIKILLDKDSFFPSLDEPNDKAFWIKKPTAAIFDDCCNEFWWLSSYVAKGLCRQEEPYAIYHLTTMRHLLFTVLSWEIALDNNFSINLGKNFKYIKNHLEDDLWNKIMKTYCNDNLLNIQKSLQIICDLFGLSSKKLSLAMDFAYPDYEEKIKAYLEYLYCKYAK